MGKIKQKITARVEKALVPVVQRTAEQLYNQLRVVRDNMNIDILNIINSTEDYQGFWELVNKYYNDYVDTTELEEE